MLYTRKGDDGTSGLFGTKERFSKQDPVYDALGTLDELISLLGVCRARASAVSDVARDIRNVQESLFVLQAELAGADKSVNADRVKDLEKVIEYYESKIVNPHSFVVPGETELSGLLDYARAVTRRAERAVLKASLSRTLSVSVLPYVNRLSSFLYILARYASALENSTERAPTY